MQFVTKSTDLGYQKLITLIFILGYFGLLAPFITLMFFMSTSQGTPTLTPETLAWATGVLGTLIGILTAEFPKQLQFWYGSSLGSKEKSAQLAKEPHDGTSLRIREQNDNE